MAIDSGSVLAVDIGGTKLAAGIVGADATIHCSSTAATSGEGAEGLFASLVEVIDVALAGTDEAPVAVGVGCGGPMTAGGATVSPLNIGQWRGFPLRDRLAEELGLPVVVDNDAKALALGEGWVGAATGVDDYLSMVVSTGVGAGIVVDGRLLDGASGNAGHLGHVIVEPLGRRCRCGARGCLEAEASGLAIAAITGAPPADASVEVRVRTGRLVGRAVASVVSLLDLRLATVAGSVALGYGETFFAAANDELQRLARLEYAQDARIVPSGRGADGPLLGAAALALGLGRGGASVVR